MLGFGFRDRQKGMYIPASGSTLAIGLSSVSLFVPTASCLLTSTRGTPTIGLGGTNAGTVSMRACTCACHTSVFLGAGVYRRANVIDVVPIKYMQLEWREKGDI